MTTSCIDTNTLASYFGGTLSEKERVQMVVHLDTCPECMEDFTSASHIMREPDLNAWRLTPSPKIKPITNFLNRIKEKLRTLFEKIRPPSFADMFRGPAFAVRTADQTSEEFDVLFEGVGGIQVEISVEERREDKTDIRVSLKNPELVKNISLALRRDGEDIGECILKGHHTTFDDLYFGCYELMLEENMIEKGTLCFELGKSGIVLKNEGGRDER